MQLNKITRLILNHLSIFVGLKLVGFIDLLYVSLDLFMQPFHFLGSLFKFIADLALSRQCDEINRSKWINPIECKGRAASSSSWGPVVCKFSMWELEIPPFSSSSELRF